MAVFNLLSSSINVYTKRDSIRIDNAVFRLHYKFTFIVLLVLSLFLTTSQLFGSPINCTFPKNFPESMMNTYCWIHSTFSIHTKDPTFRVGADVAHPGVRPHSDLKNGQDETDAEQIVEHTYYQWVCFTLFFQAVLFRIPRMLWKNAEKGLMKQLIPEKIMFAVTDKRMPNFSIPDTLLPEEKRVKVVSELSDYFTEKIEEGYRHHQRYYLAFYFCEVLNFINVVGQIYFIDLFLGYTFTDYGKNVLELSNVNPEVRLDPMDRIFPKVTKCTFYKYGGSGTVELVDALCVLPLNVLNEKIYAFLWFWFIILACLSAISILYRMVTFMSGKTRASILFARSKFLANRDDINIVADKYPCGSWFLLTQLGMNIDPRIFSEVIKNVALHIEDTTEKITANHL